MEKYDILIKNCQVLNPDMTVSSTCSVGIKDSWIKKIGPTDELMADSSASEIIDGKGKLVMPGMVDGHTHTCQQLLRGRVADEYPMVWTRFLVPFESNLLPEDSYVSGQLACLEMIKSGTTAFADSGGVHMDRVADAVIESGMRAAIAKSTMDMGNAITGAMKETANEAIENTKKLYQKYQGAGDGRVDIWFAIRQVMTCSRELIAMVGESAKEFHTGIHAHLCEHKDEVSFCLQNYKKRPAEFLEEMGILGPNLLTAHNVMLSDHDIALMAERGVKMIHCPRANLSNHGFPKAPQILEPENRRPRSRRGNHGTTRTVRNPRRGGSGREDLRRHPHRGRQIGRTRHAAARTDALPDRFARPPGGTGPLPESQRLVAQHAAAARDDQAVVHLQRLHRIGGLFGQLVDGGLQPGRPPAAAGHLRLGGVPRLGTRLQLLHRRLARQGTGLVRRMEGRQPRAKTHPRIRLHEGPGGNDPHQVNDERP